MDFDGLITHNLPVFIFMHLNGFVSYMGQNVDFWILSVDLILIFCILSLRLCWVGLFLIDHLSTFCHGFIRWVTNHYRWIVWKLACYERCYPAKTVGKFLTISNVLEELKYRYLNCLKSYIC